MSILEEAKNNVRAAHQILTDLKLLKEWCQQHDRDGLTFWTPRNYST